jgi:hypothetical protein
LNSQWSVSYSGCVGAAYRLPCFVEFPSPSISTLPKGNISVIRDTLSQPSCLCYLLVYHERATDMLPEKSAGSQQDGSILPERAQKKHTQKTESPCLLADSAAPRKSAPLPYCCAPTSLEMVVRLLGLQLHSSSSSHFQRATRGPIKPTRCNCLLSH